MTTAQTFDDALDYVIRMAGDPALTTVCPTCEATPGVRCTNHPDGAEKVTAHLARRNATIKRLANE